MAIIPASGSRSPTAQGPEGPQGPASDVLLTFTRTGTLTVAAGSSPCVVDYACTIISVRAAVGTAPTGASLICDVNADGTTVFTTQANRPTIAAGQTKSSAVVPAVTSLAAGTVLTVDVDQIGSTVAGSNLGVTVTVRKT